MYGMSSEDFWENDPKLYWAYRTFYFKKLEENQQVIDFMCWLVGGYTFQALQVTYGAMFDKDKTHVHEYPKLPNSFKKIMEEQNPNATLNQNQDYEQSFNKWARF